ncbi:MAG TPA: HK97 gp10 family phage protein [Ruminiclostridium sp.]|nr:HK97 gp10 family phage protein [Ruminiclostridium sp.]
MDTRIDLNGLDGMLGDFQKMLVRFPEEKQSLMEEAGDILESNIRNETPENIDPPEGYDHAPGKLRRSIQKKVGSGYAVVKSTEKYAHLVETGHVMRGHKPGRKVLNVKKGGVFVKGKWMFKRGTKFSEQELHESVNRFVRRVTSK